jgi:hypothetical protein
MSIERTKWFHVIALGANLVLSWLLLPLLIRPTGVPGFGDCFLLLMLFVVGLIIWPWTTVMLIVTKGDELIQGHGPADLAGVFLLPVMILYQSVYVFWLGRPGFLRLAWLHFAIIAWFWLAWRGFFSGGLSLMGKG